MARAPIFMTIEQQTAVEAILDPILSKFKIRNAFDAREIQIRDQVIIENTGNKGRFSDAILDCMFPKEKTPIDLVHYTKMDVLRSIASSCEMRLYSVAKHIGQGEGELDTFAIKHKLDGYLKGPGKPYFEELAKDIFYVSLTRPGAANEAYMWSVFGDHGNGVRLKLRITPKYADLRGIQYEQASRTLFNEINDGLAAAKQPPFLPWTISRIGGFYLPSALQVEDEVRLMVKRHVDWRNDAKPDGADEYWPVPIGVQNDFCMIEVLEIMLGAHAKRVDVTAAVTGTALSSVLIV
jgi:hypothetical protein